MKQYQQLLQELLDQGIPSTDRTGVGTLRKAGHMLRFNLQEGFPLLTTKKVHVKSVIHELLWFLSGDTNIKYLVDNGVSIWTDWPLKAYNKEADEPLTQAEFEERIRVGDKFAKKYGNLGPVYGKQWVNWQGDVLGAKVTVSNGDLTQFQVQVNHHNQIQEALNLLNTKPDDRGIVVTAWNPGDIDKVALRWCHCLFQLLVIDGKLNLEIYQRSCDTFLGLPFNIASYAFLCHMFAQQTNLEVGELIWVGGDVHLYKNHIDQAKELISREPKKLPRLVLEKADSMFDYGIGHFTIEGYEHWPAIKAEVAV